MLKQILVALMLFTVAGTVSATETEKQAPAANTVNPMDWMKMMPMMGNQQNVSAMNLARPDGWTVFMSPDNYTAFMNPATYGQFMNPQFYMQFADPNNMMAWMNPASYTTAAKGTTTAFNWFDPKVWMQMPPQQPEQQAPQQ